MVLLLRRGDGFLHLPPGVHRRRLRTGRGGYERRRGRRPLTPPHRSEAAAAATAAAAAAAGIESESVWVFSLAAGAAAFTSLFQACHGPMSDPYGARVLASVEA